MLRSSIQMQCRCAWLTAMLAWPICVLAQAQPSPVSVWQYLDFIELEEDANGLTSPVLIEPLTALGQLYFAQRDYDSAADAYRKAWQITRVNNGFDTVHELHLLADLVRTEEARGNLEVAWELEQGLLALAQRHVGRLETLPVLRELAQKRLDVWELYRTGEFPPQIILGCYYNKRNYVLLAGKADPFNSAPPDARANCISGDQHIVSLALLMEARSYQMLALEALLQNDRYASDELQELVTEILRLSHAIGARKRGSLDPLLAQMMVRLLSWESQDAASRLRRTQILLLLADMNVVRLAESNSVSGFDQLREQYQQAYSALQAENGGQEQLDAQFSPELPLVLPSFVQNPLARVDPAEAAGYIDIAFNITYRGQGRQIKIMGTSGNVSRADQRELERLIWRSNFRPRMVDGQVADSAPVVLRYYLGASP